VRGDLQTMAASGSKRQWAIEIPGKSKKSLSAFQIFHKRKFAATNRPIPAVQNIFKKVKKKLVSVLDIQ
jgi:hypothetical protein